MKLQLARGRSAPRAIGLDAQSDVLRSSPPA
jgi:hypothetical protein